MNLATRRLISALGSTLKKQTLNEKNESLEYFKANEMKVFEKKNSREVKLVYERNNKRVELTFVSGKYPEAFEEFSRESNLFPFQVSYNKKYNAMLFECMGLNTKYLVTRALYTDYPITLKRVSLRRNGEEYRGRYTDVQAPGTVNSFTDFVQENFVPIALVENCIKYARDKEKRLEYEWLGKVRSFLVDK